MNNAPTLLPSGLTDRIGSEAEAEASLSAALMAHFQACGYGPVSPPMMEFAENLQGDLETQSLRVMDPQSGHMLALRADMTMQIARIASGALAKAPRPLRLCYGGQTLRAVPDTLRQTRQFRQFGIEVFGAPAPAAEVDIMQTILTALAGLGITGLTLDLSLPTLLKDVPQTALDAVRHKDTGQLEHMGESRLAKLCAISGPAEPALEALKALDVDAALLAEAEGAIALLKTRLGDAAPAITLDPLEVRGFGYHTGLSFAIYAPSRPQALGRGGRYITPNGETAAGFTLYAEDVLPLLAPPQPLPTLLLPAHCDENTAARWRAKGYRTRYVLGETDNADYRLNDDLESMEELHA